MPTNTRLEVFVASRIVQSSFPAMDAAPAMQDALSGLVSRVMDSPYTSFFTICALLCLFTRIWTGYQNFRIQSDTTSSEKNVPIMPYWLPYLGHAPAFALSFDNLIAKGRHTTKDGVVGLSMLGTKHYIILMPSLTKKFFRQTAAVLSGDSFLYWIYEKYFGDGGANRRLPEADFHSIHKALNSMLKEPFLSAAQAKTQRLIEERTPGMISFASNAAEQHRWENFADVSVLEKQSVEANLFRLTIDYVADIASIVLMGEAFPRNNPSLHNDIWTFDEGFGTLLWGIPGVTRGMDKVKAARTRISAAVLEWHRAVVAKLSGKDPGPEWGDLSDVSEPMLARTKALQAVNAEDRVAATTQLGIYWGTLVNANKVTFWMLLEIIMNPDLEDKIRTEIAPFCRVVKDQGDGHGRLEMDVVSLMKSCPIIKATFFETMRFYVAGTSYRKVCQDLTLTEGVQDLTCFGKVKPQTYHIKAGNFLILPSALMQKDPRVWRDPENFDPGRFLVQDEDNPNKLRADLLHLNPFGGGASMCKGRLYAEREVLFFVAALLTVWDFSLNEGFKRPDQFYCGSGTANPKTPVKVRISRRP